MLRFSTFDPDLLEEALKAAKEAFTADDAGTMPLIDRVLGAAIGVLGRGEISRYMVDSSGYDWIHCIEAPGVDVYDDTIYFVTRGVSAYFNSDDIILGSVGGFIEDEEERRMEEGEIRCAYCGEFTELYGDGSVSVICDHCGKAVDGTDYRHTWLGLDPDEI